MVTRISKDKDGCNREDLQRLKVMTVCQSISFRTTTLMIKGILFIHLISRENVTV